MPELPEVETVARGLAPVLAGRRLAAVTLRRDGLRWPFPPDMGQRLTGARIEGVGRRSKYLLMPTDRAETLIVHLGMSGRMLIGGAVLGQYVHDAPVGLAAHDHVLLDTEDGTRVTFNDARRFGMMDLWPSDRLAEHPLLAGIGPEPFSDAFDAGYLARKLAGRSAPIKTLLMDQRLVAGIGNIYASEALTRVGIHPMRAAGRIGRDRLARLVNAIREVLAEAIEAGGSSLRDHRRADGEIGLFQHSFRVYDRDGAPCPTPGCTGTIRRIVQGTRSSFYCPRCQH